MISLIHPSRGRPEKAFKTAFEWRETAGTKVEYVMILDDTDHSLVRYAKLFPERDWVRADNKSVVEAANYGAKLTSGDILLYLSDDFKCFDNWAIEIEKQFEGVTKPMLLKVDDCLQNFNVPVLTIPIMNRALYNKLGYFWHPGYKSMFVDCHLYEIVKKNGWLKLAPNLKFPHEHVSIGKAQDDDTYRRSAANWEQGKKLFALHKSQGFPI